MKNSTTKKINIHFQRKLAIFYTRTLLVIKVFCAIMVYGFFYTDYLLPVKKICLDKIYQISTYCGLKIKNVVIEGLENIEDTQIISVLNTKVDSPILEIDIFDIQKRLAKNPWFKSVVVKRILPDTLHIILYENKPIAKWQFNNQIFLIDEDGNVLSEGYHEKFTNLIHVVGKDANLYTKQLIADLNQSPELSSKVVSAVRYGQRRWDLNFIQNLNVKMPENNFIQAYDYLSELNNQQKLFDQNYKVLDLRDVSKVYLEKNDK